MPIERGTAARMPYAQVGAGRPIVLLAGLSPITVFNRPDLPHVELHVVDRRGHIAVLRDPLLRGAMQGFLAR